MLLKYFLEFKIVKKVQTKYKQNNTNAITYLLTVN